MTPPLAILVFSDNVLILIPGATYAAHAATGLGDFSTSTKHILQFPATANLS
jgi:hypothetical protein